MTEGGALTLPRSYIYATRIAAADTFGRFAKMTRNDPAWPSGDSNLRPRGRSQAARCRPWPGEGTGADLPVTPLHA